MSWSAKLFGAGLGLAAALAGIAWVAGGGRAGLASGSSSLLALAAQVAAVALLRPAMGARSDAFVRGWVSGMAARGASVLVLAALMILSRGALPVIWMAVGYLGVLLPLLFLETRFLR